MPFYNEIICLTEIFSPDMKILLITGPQINLQFWSVAGRKCWTVWQWWKAKAPHGPGCDPDLAVSLEDQPHESLDSRSSQECYQSPSSSFWSHLRLALVCLVGQLVALNHYKRLFYLHIRHKTSWIELLLWKLSTCKTISQEESQSYLCCYRLRGRKCGGKRKYSM